MDYKTALKIATKAHKGQKRWNGDDYITHPIRVASNFKDDKLMQIAILHDIVEDTEVTIHDLQHKYTVSKDVCIVVSILTHYYIESYADYIMRIKSNPMAVVVKIADLKDNLRDLKKGQRKDKYELALRLLYE